MTPIVDLSHPLESGITVFPGTPPAVLEPTATVEADGYQTTGISIDSHTGTHIDAPAHMLANGKRLEAYPLETFQFDAAVADCRPLEAREPIDAEMISAALPAAVWDGPGGEWKDGQSQSQGQRQGQGQGQAHGHSQGHNHDDRALDSALNLVVVRTGWERYWNTDRYLEHPFVTPEAAEWLVANGLHLGLDTLNPDPTPRPDSETTSESESSDGYPVHHTLFTADRLIIENLCGLEAVPARFQLQAFPLPVADADGAPVRAVGMIPEAD